MLFICRKKIVVFLISITLENYTSSCINNKNAWVNKYPVLEELIVFLFGLLSNTFQQRSIPQHKRKKNQQKNNNNITSTMLHNWNKTVYFLDFSSPTALITTKHFEFRFLCPMNLFPLGNSPFSIFCGKLKPLASFASNSSR